MRLVRALLLAAAVEVGAAGDASAQSAPDSAAAPLHVHAGSPEAAVRAQWRGWSVATHAHLTLSARRDPAPRGETELFGTNMMGASMARNLGRGELALSVTGSLEPLMGADGYTLLLQTGETADGTSPLIDRQHPHDLLMGLSASYRIRNASGAMLRMEGAAVGAPALGPTSFMHRASAGGSPTVPISHHFLDATHISHGALTIGLHTGLVTFETSAFNGREPDRHRWRPDRLDLDSYAARLTVTPLGGVSLQASIGQLTEPEEIHPRADLRRTTLSASWERTFGTSAWATTVAWGRNTWPEMFVLIPAASPSLQPRVVGPLEIAPQFHVTGTPHEEPSLVIYPKLVQEAWLAESAWYASRFTAFARFERAHKNELFPIDDPRHRNLYRVAKLETGLLARVASIDSWHVGVGGSVSVHQVGRGLRSTYGERPTSFMLFVRLDLASTTTTSASDAAHLH